MSRQPHAPFPISSSGGTRLDTLEAWSKAAAPAGRDRQWKDLHSAKELARAAYQVVDGC